MLDTWRVLIVHAVDAVLFKSPDVKETSVRMFDEVASSDIGARDRVALDSEPSIKSSTGFLSIGS